MSSFGAILSQTNAFQKLPNPHVNCKAFIQNPSNPNELLFFQYTCNGKYHIYHRGKLGTINDIHSYNDLTNEFKQVKFETCEKNDRLIFNRYAANNLYVCKGIIPHTVIVMSRRAIKIPDGDDIYEPAGHDYHFYNVFNTKYLKWQKMNDSNNYIDNLTSNTESCRLVKSSDTDADAFNITLAITPFHHLFANGRQLIVFKNWIIVSGSNHEMYTSFQDSMTIYELDSQTQQPKLAKKFRLNRKYNQHKMIIISHNDHEKSPTKFDVKVLLFGGVNVGAAVDEQSIFINSFCVVNIMFCKTKYHTNIDISYKICKITSKWMEDNIFRCNYNNKSKNEYTLKCKYVAMFKNNAIDVSESCLVMNKYIVLFLPDMNDLIYFDISGIVNNDQNQFNNNCNARHSDSINEEKWRILRNRVEKMPIGKYRGSQFRKNELLCTSNAFFIFNHSVFSSTYTPNVLFKLQFSTILWDQERTIWIGFLKNENNSKCLIQQLPKDILNHILSFLH